ncbi:threonine/serine exporter family protein [Alkalithermobacter paradoxus]|uniref:Inner membrane protein YjjP n=1 Tax=Alkalithermobacter paradoxus TaxID=29349 RepID=A0A1V4IA38_9FIRM|nr:inner membrane protein YjjP [[Clostridium] thermoalcaliphilum]
MTLLEKKAILRVALYAGEIMLRNGAETYRVEDTIKRICKSRNLKHVSSFVTPTGIFISDDRFDGISFIKRVKSRTINLNKISKVNDFSREFVNSNISIKDAIMQLRKIDKIAKYPKFVRVLSAGFASSFFALLFGANFSDFVAAFIISMVAVLISSKIEKVSQTAFLSNTAGGAIIAILSIFFHTVGVGASIDMVIVGSIMPLLPGVALTNGLRDFISGDLISGVSRVSEAILIAISIAVGVGSILNVWINVFGGAI